MVIAHARPDRGLDLGALLSKVPEVTIFFWIIKVLATTVGETAADFLATNLNLGLTNTTYIMSALLAAVLVFQFRAPKYVPGIYWLAVVLISIVGTLITDNLVDNLGVSLVASTIGFVFVSVGGAGLIANLTKNILGRARPTLFETVGPLDFNLFAFQSDYASLPSGHATNMFALATVIAMLWPRGRVLLYAMAAWIAASRVLIGEHYFTDVVVGAILGTAFPYLVREQFAAMVAEIRRRAAQQKAK